MTLKEKILHELSVTPGQTDAELVEKLGVRHQAVNQACRELEKEGKLSRDNSQRPIRNYLRGDLSVVQEKEIAKRLPATDTDGLDEDSVKEILDTYLKNEGWNTNIAWGKKHGADIVAKKGNKKWIIEVKGCGSRNAMRVNYFLMILGETLQRVDDADARYSIALPDLQQFRNLWSRLPKLAKERTQIDVIFVSEDGQIIFDD